MVQHASAAEPRADSRVRPSRDRCRRGGDGRRFAEERKRSFSETHPLARELRRRVRMKQTPTLTHVQPELEERLARDARRAVSLANAVPDHVQPALRMRSPIMWTAPPTHQLLTLCVPSHWTRTACVSRRPSCLYVLLILLSAIVLQPALQAVGLDEVTPCTSDSLADSVAHCCTVDPEVVINISATEDQRMVPICVDVSTAGVQEEKASPHRFSEFSGQLLSDPTMNSSLCWFASWCWYWVSQPSSLWQSGSQHGQSYCIAASSPTWYRMRDCWCAF